MANTDTNENNLSIVDEAKKVRDEIRAENDRREKIMAEEQKLKAEQMLAGTSGAVVKPPEPVVETPRDYANKILRGGK